MKNHSTNFILILATFFSCSDSEYKIIVPNGYVGEVCLIKSNVTTNKLTIHSNGIGYINEETFDDLLYQPSVFDASGKDLSKNCIGYSPSAFWALGNAESGKTNLQINFKSFEIVPDSLIGKKQYYDVDLFKVVDTLIVK